MQQPPSRTLQNVAFSREEFISKSVPFQSAIRNLQSAILTALLLPALAFAAETGTKTPELPKADKPFKIPDGAAHEGWELYLKNDFAAAEKSLLAAVEKDAKDLNALEGLRSIYVALGDFKKVQDINLRMVKADPQNILAAVFAARAMDLLPYVETRELMLRTFTEAAAAASPAVQSQLMDQIVSLRLRADEPEPARRALEGLGYIDRWQFVAGPFGRKDRNDESIKPNLLIERRFAPERELTSLDFTDESGEKVIVHNNVPANFRELNLEELFHGANGVFYAFANLESGSDQDVFIIFAAGQLYKAFLRGMPIVKEPGEEQFRRAGGDLVRVRLTKGSNPLLVKVSSSRSMVVRLFGSDYGPPKDVRIAPLDKAALAAHRASSVRGLLMSEKTWGSAADAFVKRSVVRASRPVDPETDSKEGPAETPGPRDEKSLLALVNSGELTVPEAGWLDVALQRENDNRARLALANTLVGSFPDSVGELDNAANILTAAGRAMYDSAAREAETARQFRERALKIMPTSHQHLLSMYYFYQENNLKEQAFAPAKSCADAHPDSPAAQFALGAAYQDKQFFVEAEKCYEKAAALDDAYLPRLTWFHEFHGNRERARELYRKEVSLGFVDRNGQFERALRRGEIDQAASLLETQEKSYPERATEWQRMRVRLLVEKGSIKDAFSLQKKLYEAQPEYDPQRRGTLEELVDLAIRADKSDDAKALLSAYLKENMGDYELRRQLQDLEGASTIQWWEPYDVKVPQIDTSAFTAEKYPTANHAEIVDFMVTRLLPDFSRESYTHVAQKVLNNQGINELSELLVQSQRGDIVFVRTLNPDGSSFQPQNVHSFNFSQTASLYKVGPGSILEHAYIGHDQANKDNPTLSMGFNFNAIDSPRAVSRWIVMIPDAIKDKLTIRRIRPEMVDEQILPGPQGYTVHQWTNKQVEGIKAERYMPGNGDLETVPMVLIDSAEDPERANRWLAYHERDFIPVEATEKARALVKDIDAKNEKLRFKVILSFVRDTIHVGNDSRTLDDVWFLHAGSHAQMTGLAREMAKAVGLNVSSAYINASYQPARTWHSKNAKHNWEPRDFNAFGNGGQALVLEQKSGADFWAFYPDRGSPRYYDFSAMNMNQAGALALVLDKGGQGGARVKRVHGEELGQVALKLRVQVALDAQGTGTVNADAQYMGPTAGMVREALSDPQRGPRTREWIVRQSFPKMKIEKTAIANENRVDEPLGVSYSGAVANLAALAGTSYFLPPFLRPAGMLDLQGPPERLSDMLIKSEFSDLDHTVTYVAPEGFGWVEVPKGLFIANEFGFYLADFKVKGRTLTCTRSYLMPQQRITPEKYPALMEFLSKVSASQQQRIAYGPLDTASFPTVRSILTVGDSGFGEDAVKKPTEVKP